MLHNLEWGSEERKAFDTITKFYADELERAFNKHAIEIGKVHFWATSIKIVLDPEKKSDASNN